MFKKILGILIIVLLVSLRGCMFGAVTPIDEHHIETFGNANDTL